MKTKRVLYVVECRMAETGEWHIYGAEPYAFATRSKADKVRIDAKRFNRSQKLNWSFRVIPYVPRGVKA